MIVFPHCKINLGLHVVCKRPDGFHDIETIFYPVLWKDILEVTEGSEDNFNMDISGLTINGDPKSNLIYKAWGLLKSDYSIPPIQVHFHKLLPMGAGLGGGSADAAFMLKLLNSKYNLGISTEKLKEYAARLGSDCPFFIESKPCIATGRGEILAPISLDLSNYQIVIVMPKNISVGTAEAYSWVNPKVPEKSLLEIIDRPIYEWRNYLKNDFEEAVIKHHPKIGEIKNQLYEKGALYASMSGSGAAVFGIFEKGKAMNDNFLDCQVWKEN
ncbi:MAG: 4-(cytidine 5'-diphospho)-2-C-methyl-D-erythritol kinase [Bacteroidota bacterium]